VKNNISATVIKTKPKRMSQQKIENISKREELARVEVERMDRKIIDDSRGMYTQPLKMLKPFDSEILAEYKSKYRPNEVEETDAEGNVIKMKAFILPQSEPEFDEVPIDEHTGRKRVIVSPEEQNEFQINLKIHQAALQEEYKREVHELRLMEDDLKSYMKSLDMYADESDFDHRRLTRNHIEYIHKRLRELHTIFNTFIENGVPVDAIEAETDNLEAELLEANRFLSEKPEFFSSGVENRREFLLGVQEAINLRKSQIEGQKKLIADVENRIEQLDQQRLIALNDIDENNRIVNAVKMKNLDKAYTYRDELNALNSGAFNSEKRPEEEEDEYLDRLKRTAHTQTPIDEFTAAKEIIFKKFKDKMKELIRDPAKIEQVANTFSYEEKFQILKVFAEIKRTFIRKHGQFNSLITASDLIEFFRMWLDSPRGKPTEDEIDSFAGEDMGAVYSQGSDVDETENPMREDFLSRMFTSDSGEWDMEALADMRDLGEVYEVVVNESMYPNTAMIIPRGGGFSPTFYLRVGNAPQFMNKKKEDARPSDFLLYSTTGRNGSFRMFRSEKELPRDAREERKSDKLFEEFLLDPGHQILTKLFLPTRANALRGDQLSSAIAGSLLAPPYRLRAITLRDGLYETPEENFPKGGNKYYNYGNGLHGYGIKNEKMPSRAEFGTVLVNPKKLFYENVLSVKHHTGKSIAGFPNCKVSDHLVKVVLDLLKNVTPNTHTFEKLSSGEREIMDHLFRIGGLSKKHGSGESEKKTVSELKKRLELLQGEVSIGNNSPAVYKEIQRILIRLRDFRQITNKAMKEYLSQFKKY